MTLEEEMVDALIECRRAEIDLEEAKRKASEAVAALDRVAGVKWLRRLLEMRLRVQRANAHASEVGQRLHVRDCPDCTKHVREQN